MSSFPASERSGVSTSAAEGFERVADLAELADGDVMGVTLRDGTAVCLARHGDEVFAMLDRCTHQAFPMTAGELLPDCTIQCAWHGARFDLRTGAVQQGPALDAIETLEARVAGGEILVRSRGV
jgi:3-phenylpropionate/trans-cinnamate dioxygenase ferredoxin component